MANININLEEVININARLPRCLIILTEVKRELELLKWKLDSEVMLVNNMSEKYTCILKQINQVEEQIVMIHKCVSSAIVQYKYQERISENYINYFD